MKQLSTGSGQEPGRTVCKAPNTAEANINHSMDYGHHGSATGLHPHAATARAKDSTQLPDVERGEGDRLPDPTIAINQQITLPPVPKTSGGSHNQCNLRKLVPTDTAKQRKGEDSHNDLSSGVTEQPSHPTKATKRTESSKPARTEVLDPHGKRPHTRSDDNSIRPTALCLKGKHGDINAPYRKSAYNGGGNPSANGACDTKQDAKKRRRAAFSPAVGPRAKEGGTKTKYITPLQLGSHGQAMMLAQYNDAKTSHITQQCDGKERQSVYKKYKATQEHSRDTVQSDDATTGKQDLPPINTTKTGITTTAPYGNEAAEIHSANGRGETRLPKRDDGGATHPKAAAKKRAMPAVHARRRHTAGAHTKRPRNDAGIVALRPPKRRGAHAKDEVIRPSPARDGKTLLMHSARPAGGALVRQSQRHPQRYASEDTVASAQAGMVRRLAAPPIPVPDARLTGRGWHERWPPPAQGTGGLNGCAAL